MQDPYGNLIASGDGWVLTYYLRADGASGGLSIQSASYGGVGWQTTINASTTATLTPGDLFFQARAAKDGEVHTLWGGKVRVVPALTAASSAAAFDGRTQSEIDLEAVQTAIRSLISGGGVKKYTIGTRSLEKFTLAELMELESRLKARVQRELAAEKMANGLGNPRNLFVRFG
jgi:hypothetical protein